MDAIPDFHPLAELQAASALLLDWERLTRSAHCHFHEGRLDAALALQSDALRHACSLMATALLDLRPDDVLAAWVVSHHNLADTRARRQEYALAAEHLLEAHAGLVDLAETPGNSATLRQSALRHMRETRWALLAWQRDHGHHTPVDTSLPLLRQGDPSAGFLH